MPEVLPLPHECRVVDISDYGQVLEAARGVDALVNVSVLRHELVPAFRATAGNSDLKLKTEIARLELLVKKLQTELQIERQYNQALEQHLHNLTTAE